MNRLKMRNTILLSIVAALLVSLTACENPATEKKADVTAEVTPSSDVTAVSAADGKFTARYDSEYGFNPLTGTSPDNMALVPLMYEGLFVLNDKMVAEPVLCDQCDTPDGITYTITIKQGIAMSDGSNLNAADVKYTLTSAMQGGRFAGRLNIISAVATTDTQTVKITLKSKNYKLPELLDIPIIKNGTDDQNYPPGSGPYRFAKTGDPRLEAFSGYRDAAKMPIQVIYLKDCSNSELSVDFSSQAVDLFQDDPFDSSAINILSDHEIRYYNTTILQYVGFNTKNSVLAMSELRRAFGLIIDRKAIVSSIYSSHALAAPLILSPNYRLYSTSWEGATPDMLAKLSEIFASLQMQDDDSDGYLEIPSGGVYVPFTLKFIVNSDNAYKVRAAQMITDSLKTVGINVNLTKLTWDEYKKALEKGEFDMYYGDVCLPADYDLSGLLSPGSALDYGHVANADYKTHIDDFLAAADDDSEREAAKSLCAYIADYAPVIPVLYRQMTVHTNKNVVSGIKPTQSDIFYDLTKWNITLGS